MSTLKLKITEFATKYLSFSIENCRRIWYNILIKQVYSHFRKEDNK